MRSSQSVRGRVLQPPSTPVRSPIDFRIGASHLADAVTPQGVVQEVLKVVTFVAVMLVVGRRSVPWLLGRVVQTGSRELFTLAVLAIALGIAVGAATLFGVSSALGAFFAGVIVSESDFSHEAATNALPLQDAFAVLFFVSVGMLFDPTILLREPSDEERAFLEGHGARRALVGERELAVSLTRDTLRRYGVEHDMAAVAARTLATAGAGNGRLQD